MAEDEGETVTVSADGVSVRKRIETERFPTLAVELEIVSDRDDQATVLITEEIPADISADDVGFHPNFGEGYWSVVDDDSIAFERELGAGSTYTTIYGFRDFPEERSAELLNDPELEIKSVDADPDDAEADTGVADTEPEADDRAMEAEPVVQTPASGSIVQTIAKELDRGIAGPEERRMLREELRKGEDHQEPRIHELQREVSDLEAYIDALEDFLESEGTADQIYDRFSDDIESLEEELEAVSAEVEPVLDEVDTLDDEVDELAEAISAAESRLDRLADGIDDFDAQVSDIDSQIDEQNDAIDDISSDVGGVDDRIDEVEDELSAIESDLDELRSDIREDIRALEADLDDFAELRERLASVFGSGMEMGGSDIAEAAEDDSSDAEPESAAGDESADSTTEENAASEPATDSDDEDTGSDDDESTEE